MFSSADVYVMLFADGAGSEAECSNGLIGSGICHVITLSQRVVYSRPRIIPRLSAYNLTDTFALCIRIDPTDRTTAGMADIYSRYLYRHQYVGAAIFLYLIFLTPLNSITGGDMRTRCRPHSVSDISGILCE